MIVTTTFWISSDTFIIPFYTSNISNFFILHFLRWSHGWPKHVAVHCVYKTNFSILANVGINIVRGGGVKCKP